MHINDQTVDDEAVIPFGGIKASGSGGHFGGRGQPGRPSRHLQWVTVQSADRALPVLRPVTAG